jgi:hypothetical protein
MNATLSSKALSINRPKANFSSPKSAVYMFKTPNGFGFVAVRGIIGGGRGQEKPKREKKPEEPIPLLVTPAWVQEQLRYGKVKVLDATWGIEAKNWRDDYIQKRIPGALYFDIDKICDTTKDLPHMLPKPIPYERTWRPWVSLTRITSSSTTGVGSLSLLQECGGLFPLMVTRRSLSWLEALVLGRRLG